MNCRVSQLQPGDEIYHRGKWRIVEDIALDFDNIYCIGIDTGPIFLSGQTMVLAMSVKNQAVAEAERIVRKVAPPA